MVMKSMLVGGKGLVKIPKYWQNFDQDQNPNFQVN